MQQWITKAGRFVVERAEQKHFTIPIKPGAPPTGVLHTTEGGWEGAMAVFRVHYAPHFIVGAGRIAQMVPVGTIGASLVTHNNLALVQVELVGRSRTELWQPDPETLETLAALLATCKSVWKIPLTRVWADGDYGVWGANPHRRSGKFGTVAGWYGHGDVPSPDVHWDPGALRWSVVFARASEMLKGAKDGSAS